MSTETKWTPGPLTVRMASKWPWNIETVDADGEMVFSTQLYCISARDESAKEALDCTHVKADKRGQHSAANYRALADETIRAAAPELYKTLDELLGYFRSGNAVDVERATIKANAPEVLAARAALKKARGE